MIKREDVPGILHQYKNELTVELANILNYWQKYAPDEVHGGFYGRIDNNNRVIAKSPKGSVLNARILWSFSAAYTLTRETKYLEMAQRAYFQINKYFIDAEFGGVYWSVDYRGVPLDTKKQVYAIAFTIYAFCEYFRATRITEARDKAIGLYRLLVAKSYHTQQTGYLEAFSRTWEPLGDLRLSAKDANEKKTMNTHLHVLEAYTNLYRIWPDAGLELQLKTLLQNFLDHFIDHHTYHLRLFFNEDWEPAAPLISYGHDIEAAWLLLQAAEAIHDEVLTGHFKKLAVPITRAVLEAIDTDGGLWYEYEPAHRLLISEKHWWVQAEAMVGFFNTWQITGDTAYLQLSVNNWGFVKDKLLDRKNGEWFWGVDAAGRVMNKEDKIGLWKCPYHNSRACMELIKRIDENK
jgi:mannobiose 2-epimerase